MYSRYLTISCAKSRILFRYELSFIQFLIFIYIEQEKINEFFTYCIITFSCNTLALYLGLLERWLSDGSFEFPNSGSTDATQSREIRVQRDYGLPAEARLHAKTWSKLRSFFRGRRRYHHRAMHSSDHSRAILVGQEGGHVRGSWYVRSTGGHN